MLDQRLLKDDPEFLRRACRLKRAAADVDRAVAADARRRALLLEKETLQNERNRVNRELAGRIREGGDVSAEREEMRRAGDRVAELEAEERALREEVRALLLAVPNHPDPEAPEGDETANREIAAWGGRPEFAFPPRPHWEIGEELGLFDFRRGTKLAGSGFILYRGDGARLERALFNFFLDFHTSRRGYLEWFPPFLVNRDSMTGTGQLPKMEEDMYACDKGDGLFLIPTAEVPVTNIHRDDVLAAADLPLRYCAYSACFRREAGAAGKDTRGLLRVHQFNKVELVNFVHPDRSREAHENLRADVEAALRELELPYRILDLASGDLSFAAARCYDFEVWAAGVGRFLEASSCSNFGDYQARRANIRFREGGGGPPRLVHTLNASGLALPRTLAAIIENNQREDGSLGIPRALRPYLGGQAEIRKP